MKIYVKIDKMRKIVYNVEHQTKKGVIFMFVKKEKIELPEYVQDGDNYKVLAKYVRYAGLGKELKDYIIEDKIIVSDPEMVIDGYEEENPIYRCNVQTIYSRKLNGEMIIRGKKISTEPLDAEVSTYYYYGETHKKGDVISHSGITEEKFYELMDNNYHFNRGIYVPFFRYNEERERAFRTYYNFPNEYENAKVMDDIDSKIEFTKSMISEMEEKGESDKKIGFVRIKLCMLQDQLGDMHETYGHLDMYSLSKTPSLQKKLGVMPTSKSGNK